MRVSDYISISQSVFLGAFYIVCSPTLIHVPLHKNEPSGEIHLQAVSVAPFILWTSKRSIYCLPFSREGKKQCVRPAAYCARYFVNGVCRSIVWLLDTWKAENGQFGPTASVIFSSVNSKSYPPSCRLAPEVFLSHPPIVSVKNRTVSCGRDRHHQQAWPYLTSHACP